MRNVIVQEFVSVDGMAAAADGSVDFIPAANKGDESFGQRQLDFIDSIDAILLGRVTYEMFAGYWPNVTDDDEKPFADRINAIPKIVFSTTLQRAPWGSFEPARIVRTNASEEVGRLKQSAGKDMVLWGSLSLAQSLMKECVVDEVQLIVCPVVLGGGRSVFAERAENLTLRKTQAFDGGSVLLAYSAR